VSGPTLDIPEALILRAQQGDIRAQNEVVRAMLPTVKRIARDWQRHADVDDLVSEGLIGVAAALRNWQPVHNAAPFPAWARKHVSGAISRYAAGNASIIKLGSKDHATMIGRGNAAARAQLAPRLGVNQRSLDEPAGPDTKMTLGEATPSPLLNAEEALASRGEEDSRVDLLEALLEQMPDLERAVLEVRYFVGSSITMSKRGAALLVEYAKAEEHARREQLGKSKRAARQEVETVKLRDLARLLQMDKEQARQAELRGLDMLARALAPGRSISAKTISRLLSPDTRTRLAKKAPKQLGLFGAETLGEKPRCRFCRKDRVPGREVCQQHTKRKEKCPSCGRCLPYRDQCGRQLTYCSERCRRKGAKQGLRPAASRKAARTLTAPTAPRKTG
jgi:RNA polymerase sigma factor (sigma-70 family)